MKRRALITGISGQDGSYLAEYLIKKKYMVFGCAVPGHEASRISHIREKIAIVEADLADESSLADAIKKHDPAEIYNLASPSFPPASWNHPADMANIVALGTSRLLEAVKNTNPEIKIFQAGSSEMFGWATTPAQNEDTPFKPRNPYGTAKLYAYWTIANWREKYGLHASNGILFNHESPRRGHDFVTRKISMGAAGIRCRLSNEIVLGDLEARRDWGFAGDYVNAMWLMLQQKNPGDYVIATGETHSVKDVVEIAFEAAGINNWESHIRIDKSLIRPPEKYALCGDSAKARKILGWKPEVSFKEMIQMMVESDIKLAENKTQKSGFSQY